MTPKHGRLRNGDHKEVTLWPGGSSTALGDEGRDPGAVPRSDAAGWAAVLAMKRRRSLVLAICLSLRPTPASAKPMPRRSRNFELVLNLPATQAIGVDIPPSVPLRAERVIR
jgi:hypothetical protein